MEVIQKQVRELKAEQLSVESDLKTVGTSIEEIRDTQNQRLDAVKAQIDLLRLAINEGNSVKARSVLSEIVDRVDITAVKEPWGKRFRYNLSNAYITFKTSVLNVLTSPAICDSKLFTPATFGTGGTPFFARDLATVTVEVHTGVGPVNTYN